MQLERVVDELFLLTDLLKNCVKMLSVPNKVHRKCLFSLKLNCLFKLQSAFTYCIHFCATWMLGKSTAECYIMMIYLICV